MVGHLGFARERNADAHAQVAAVVRRGEGNGADQRLRDLGRRLAFIAQAVEQGELVTAPAAEHGLHLGGFALQPVGHVLQDAVAHLVAEGVVHRLEAVEVQQQQGMLAAIVRGEVQRGRVGEAFAVEQAGERVVRGAEGQLLRRVERLRVRLAQLHRHGGGLVADAAACAEIPVAVHRATHERRQVQQHHRRQAQVVEAARIGQAAGHRQQRRHNEADRHERISDAVGNRPCADTAHHRQVEHRLRRGVPVAQQRDERPHAARHRRHGRRDPQMPLDRAGIRRGRDAVLGHDARPGREGPAADVAADAIHHERQQQPAKTFEGAAGVQGDQRRDAAQHHVDGDGREHAAAHRHHLVGAHHARQHLFVDGRGER
ncbi:hypothetical protein GGD71_005372 [Variovorax guangxiensis]|uniref:Uncharacterized protein n=1 Tax=Variovorax guangxiensis TaxID=1775474 RepID=A0A840FPR4_9BURK|nr:hypothetical protein [Variovorax guangxiensis]